MSHGVAEPGTARRRASSDSTSVLDIGDHVGAVVVTMPDPAASGELWACRRRTPEARFHTGVHARTVGGETMWVALFPQVDEGEYSLLTDLWEEGVHFVVTGGEVTTIDL